MNIIISKCSKTQKNINKIFYKKFVTEKTKKIISLNSQIKKYKIFKRVILMKIKLLIKTQKFYKKKFNRKLVQFKSCSIMKINNFNFSWKIFNKTWKQI